MKLDTAEDVLAWAKRTDNAWDCVTCGKEGPCDCATATAERLAYCVRVTEIVESYDEGRCGCDTAGNILAAAAQKEGE